MAHTEVFLVVVDEGLYVGNGLVHRWLKRVGNNLYHNIVFAAPQRTGELKAGIVPDIIQHESLRILSTTVESTAPHTKYVIHGTAENGAGYIYSNQGFKNLGLLSRVFEGEFVDFSEMGGGFFMVLSDARGGRYLRVHGQHANNFMLTGYDRTARTHRALHPIFPGLVT